jgi:hypothetical protein
VEHAPGEDAERIVGEEVAADEEQQPGDDRRVQRKAARYFAAFDGGITRAPQEQTMLRVGQKMRSRRPQAAQPMYVPAGRTGEASWGRSARDFMGSPAAAQGSAPRISVRRRPRRGQAATDRVRIAESRAPASWFAAAGIWIARSYESLQKNR